MNNYEFTLYRLDKCFRTDTRDRVQRYQSTQKLIIIFGSQFRQIVVVSYVTVFG